MKPPTKKLSTKLRLLRVILNFSFKNQPIKFKEKLNYSVHLLKFSLKILVGLHTEVCMINIHIIASLPNKLCPTTILYPIPCNFTLYVAQSNFSCSNIGMILFCNKYAQFRPCYQTIWPIHCTKISVHFNKLENYCAKIWLFQLSNWTIQFQQMTH